MKYLLYINVIFFVKIKCNNFVNVLISLKKIYSIKIFVYVYTYTYTHTYPWNILIFYPIFICKFNYKYEIFHLKKTERKKGKRIKYMNKWNYDYTPTAFLSYTNLTWKCSNVRSRLLVYTYIYIYNNRAYYSRRGAVLDSFRRSRTNFSFFLPRFVIVRGRGTVSARG